MSADTKEIALLKRRAAEAEFQLIERHEPGGLHVIVIGNRVVHWWPESRRKTAYVEGAARGMTYRTAKDVIKLAEAGEEQQ